jgi:hypothetical protein
MNTLKPVSGPMPISSMNTLKPMSGLMLISSATPAATPLELPPEPPLNLQGLSFSFSSASLLGLHAQAPHLALQRLPRGLRRLELLARPRLPFRQALLDEGRPSRSVLLRLRRSLRGLLLELRVLRGEGGDLGVLLRQLGLQL